MRRRTVSVVSSSFLYRSEPAAISEQRVTRMELATLQKTVIHIQRVTSRRGRDEPEADVEALGVHQELPLLRVRLSNVN